MFVVVGIPNTIVLTAEEKKEGHEESLTSSLPFVVRLSQLKCCSIVSTQMLFDCLKLKCCSIVSNSNVVRLSQTQMLFDLFYGMQKSRLYHEILICYFLFMYYRIEFREYIQTANTDNEVI